MEGRKSRVPEPPTLAFRLKTYKAAIQQLRCVVRALKENTTVSFLPTPALVVQTCRERFVTKIIFGSGCLYLTDPSFAAKTINNHVPLLGNLMYMTSNRELTRFVVQDTSDLHAKISMDAADYQMTFSPACVHGQEIVRENGDSVARVDLEHGVVAELLKWLAPHTRPKRPVGGSGGGSSSSSSGGGGGVSSSSSKKPTSGGSATSSGGAGSGSGGGSPSHPAPGATVQISLHVNPPAVKFALGGGSGGAHVGAEIEFTANNHVAFHEVKPLRFAVNARNLAQALSHCAVTKLTCSLRVITEPGVVLYLTSKNSHFALENFLVEEPFVRGEVAFDAPGSGGGGGGGGGHYHANNLSGDEFTVCADRVIESVAQAKRHERSGASRKNHPSGLSSGGGGGGKDRYDQHQNKITNFLVAKGLGGGGVGDHDRGSDRGSERGADRDRGSERERGSERGGYFNDAKQESESDDDSLTFEYNAPNAKKAKCHA